MLDLVASALPAGMEIDAAELLALKREAFLAVLDEEEPRLRTDPGLVAGIRREVEAISAVRGPEHDSPLEGEGRGGGVP
jgi:hypothetical protein